MRILTISGRNLASLAGDFCIDFEQEPLASSGLFAITGPTGAGKSTLLDALCLALYDATPRMQKLTRNGALLPDVGAETVSAQDPRTLLRRGSAEAHAQVDFVGNDQQRYRARWSVRRARAKSAGGLQKSAMTLQRLPELLALGATKTEVLDQIQRRIGLNFEQFTRAVLLAQNEFSAFLKTEENERGELLETLTGSDIYSVLSKRAFERFKSEEQALRQLAARLADQAPLAPEVRADIDRRGAVATAALDAFDVRKALLEQQLRWRQDADRLQQQVTLAEQVLADATLALEAAAPQRSQLAMVEAAQDAAPLLAERQRVGADQQQARAALASGTAALAQAQLQQQAAQAALAACNIRLGDSETARSSAAPQLDQAKALDASIAVLAPAHAAAAAAHAAAHAQQQEANARRDAGASLLERTRTEHQAGAAWLEQRRAHAAIAQQWPRWDQLLSKAARSAQDARESADALPGAQQAEAMAAAAHVAAAAAFNAHRPLQDGREQARQLANAAAAAFDTAAMHAARSALDARREQLQAAERAWTELAALTSRRDAAQQHGRQLAATHGAAEAALAQALAAHPPLAAAHAQAERSLRAAQLACADNIGDLRASLADGEACPVCGSKEHPYHHQDAMLAAMLAGLQQQVAICDEQLRANLALQAAQRAIAANTAAQITAAAADQADVQAALAACETAWRANALAASAPPPEQRAAWFAGQQAQLRGAVQERDAQEAAARQAAQARDIAQAACDAGANEHAQLQRALAGAATTLADAGAARAALAGRVLQLQSELALLLDELDPAFTAGDGWRAAWQAAPGDFHDTCRQQAQAWTSAASQHAARELNLATLAVEQAGLAAIAAQAGQAAALASSAFAGIDADIGAKQAARRALFDGQTVQQVEAALDGAVAAARAAHAEAGASGQQAAQAEARAREALVQGEQRLAALAAQAGRGAAALENWLAGWPQRHPGLACLADIGALETLLQYDTDWLQQRRQALAALDGAAASAATVLAERRAQCALHQQADRPGDEAMASDLQATLAALLEERRGAADLAGALRLQQAQDDARRAGSAAIMADLERQQMVERRWAKLNELIGSADGKKFRNYAQQFTLDVLLGYANSHLGQLARRYRLERVLQASGPSLGLMVRDQDMGGEVRSVNSLSGGESFLVSLALALGLASLSSNRVRVESLFIDEGFGSLDSDTLRVAMDALDGLQALGRKVGVISHVQEMTDRIAARIVVQPGGGGSSAVSVR